MSEEQNNKVLMSVLAYLGPLVIVSFFAAPKDPFVRFHVGQGLVLFIIEIAVWFLGSVFWPLWMLLQIINLGVLILAIIGIINAVNNRERKLPLVGDFARHFKL